MVRVSEVFCEKNFYIFVSLKLKKLVKRKIYKRMIGPFILFFEALLETISDFFFFLKLHPVIGL